MWLYSISVCPFSAESRRRLKFAESLPKLESFFLSQHESSQVAQTALATGALAYVVKSAATRDLVLAVQAAAQGKTFLSQLE